MKTEVDRARRPGRRGEPAGFTLVEILLAVALGALLLTGLTRSTQLFSSQVADLRNETDLAAEELLLSLGESVRSAWMVERPAVDRVEVTDPYGNTTAWFLQGSAVQVTRPSGTSGELLAGVADLRFELQTTRRLRDTAPVDSYGSVWNSSPGGTPVSLTLQEGQSLAIAFSAPAPAPASLNPVAGVQEELIQASLDRLLLPINYMDLGPASFCHLLASPPHPPNHPSGTGTLVVELYEARAPGDARPYGNLLGSTSVPAASLPVPGWSWWDSSTGAPSTYPQTSGGGGASWGWWTNHPELLLIVDPPSSPVPIDMASFTTLVEPGRAYSLVLRSQGVQGTCLLSVSGLATASSAASGVALESVPGGGFAPLAMQIALGLEGMRTYTQTADHDVTTSVLITLDMADGRRLTTSANVAGQATINPWWGVAPGEYPTLEMQGM